VFIEVAIFSPLRYLNHNVSDCASRNPNNIESEQNPIRYIGRRYGCLRIKRTTACRDKPDLFIIVGV
jgi:hypothetical protein